MENIKNTNTTVGIKLNKGNEIIEVVYDNVNLNKGEVVTVLELTENEIKKLQNDKISYIEILKELNLKYETEIQKILNPEKNETTNYITKIINKIGKIIPKVPFPRSLNFSKVEK